MASWFADRLRQAEALLNQADQLASQAKQRVVDDRNPTHQAQGDVIHERRPTSTWTNLDDGPSNDTPRSNVHPKPRPKAQPPPTRRGKQEDEGGRDGSGSNLNERERASGTTTTSTRPSPVEIHLRKQRDEASTRPGSRNAQPRRAEKREETTGKETKPNHEARKDPRSKEQASIPPKRDPQAIDQGERARQEAAHHQEQVEKEASHAPSGTKHAVRPSEPTTDVHASRTNKETERKRDETPTPATPDEKGGTTRTSVEAPSKRKDGSNAIQARTAKTKDASVTNKDAQRTMEHDARGVGTTLDATPSQSSRIDTKKFKDAALDTLYILGLAESDPEEDSDEETERRKETNRRIAEDKLIQAVRMEVEKLEARNAEKEKERKALEDSFQAKRMEHLKQVRALQQSIQERADSRSKEKDAAEVERLQAWEKVALLEADRDAMAQKLSELERSSNTALAREQEAQSVCTELEAACAQLQSEISALSDKMESRTRHITFEAQEQASTVSEEQQAELTQLEETVTMLEKRIEEHRNREHDHYSSMHTTREDQEMDARLHALSNNLIHMQAELESLATEKAALQMGLETAQRMAAELEANLKEDHRYIVADSEPDVESGDSQAKARRRSQLFLRLSSYFGVEYAHHITTFLANADRFAITACNLLYRYPSARVGLAIYFGVVQFWVLFLLHYLDAHSDPSNGAEIHLAQ